MSMLVLVEVEARARFLGTVVERILPSRTATAATLQKIIMTSQSTGLLTRASFSSNIEAPM